MTTQGWRKLKVEDCKTGVLVRIGNMTDTCYNGATILRVEARTALYFKDQGRGNVEGEREVYEVNEATITVARPYAYASKDYDSKQPLLGCEVFGIHISERQPRTDLEVYEGRDGILRSMAT